MGSSPTLITKFIIMVMSLTGHRPHKLGNEYDGGPISTALFKELQVLLAHYKPEKIISGMALGADQIWADAALKMGIPVIAAVPCDNQDKMWPSKSQEKYRKMLSHCAEVHIVCPGPYAGWKMQKRNEWMVDNSDILIAVYDGSTGGTANCVKYAEKYSREIIYITPEFLKNPLQ